MPVVPRAGILAGMDASTIPSLSVPEAMRALASEAFEGYREGVEPPLVGRTSELEALREAARKADRSGRLVQVVLSGPPGIGKSRLAWAFADELEATAGSAATVVRAVAGEGISSAAGLAGQIVRNRFELETGHSDELVRASLRRGLERWIPVVARGRWVAWLGSLVGLPAEGSVAATGPTDTKTWRRRSLRALGEVLRMESAERPLFLVLDGLDSVALDQREALADVLRPLLDRPATVVLTARAPDLSPPALPEGTTLRLALEPLAPDHVERLASVLLGEPPPPAMALLRRVLEPTAGVPRKILELVRALTSSGAVSIDDGRLAFDESRLMMGAATDPRLAAHHRISRLSAPEREVLVAAAVFGDHFWFDGVLSVLWAGRTGADRDPTDADRVEMGLQRALLELMRKDMIRFVDESWSRLPRRVEGTAEMAFAFPVERKALWETVPAEERERFEAWAGRWMLRAMPREGHIWYRDAARMLDRTARSDLAVEAWIRAGDAAVERDREEAALHAYQEARAPLADDDERIARVLPGLTLAQEGLGQVARALESTSQLLRWSRVLGDRILATRTMLHQGRLLLRLEKPVQAREVLARALSGCDTLGLDAERALAEETLAEAAAADGTAQGRVSALAHLERALSHWRSADSEADVARVHATIATHQAGLGFLPQAREGAGRAAAWYREGEDPVGLARSLHVLGSAAVLAGEPAAAREAWSEALGALAASPDDVLVATVNLNLAEVDLMGGEDEAAEKRARKALRRARVLGNHRLEGLAHHRLAAILRQRGELEDARAEARTALKLGEATGDRRLEVLGRRGVAEVEARLLARLIARADRVDPARLEEVGSHLHEACMQAEAVGDRPGLARSLESYADYLDAWGAGRKARKVRLRAEQLREAMLEGLDGIPAEEPDTGAGGSNGAGALPAMPVLEALEASRRERQPLYGEPFDV